MMTALLRPSFATRAALVLASVVLAGCLDEDEDAYECEPTPLLCTRYAPSSADLTVQVGGGNLQEIKVYRGPSYEDGTLVWSGFSGTTLRLPLGEYSATATYLLDGKTIVAVDGDELGYTSEDYCTGTCYEEDDGMVDLRLEE